VSVGGRPRPRSVLRGPSFVLPEPLALQFPAAVFFLAFRLHGIDFFGGCQVIDLAGWGPAGF